MNHGSISLPIVPPKKLQKGILVNGHGVRFINEDAYFGRIGEHAVYRQDGRAYLVLDAETFERPDIERDIAGVGESIEELESELGLPEGSLQSTVDLYNRHAHNGGDPIFHKSSDYCRPAFASSLRRARLHNREFALRGFHARWAANIDRRRGPHTGRRSRRGSLRRRSNHQRHRGARLRQRHLDRRRHLLRPPRWPPCFLVSLRLSQSLRPNENPDPRHARPYVTAPAAFSAMIASQS